MSKTRQIIITAGLLMLTLGSVSGKLAVAHAATQLHASAAEAKQRSLLSSYWPPAVQQWASLIYKMAYVKGLDPDFVAAVVMAESSGDPNGVSYAGAVGLMGVMPSDSGPGLEFRPNSEELTDPHTNLSWGVAILADIVQQSGGDVFAALSAYNGGWPNANRSVPQEYAAEVLDEYARAVLVRSGGDPTIAEQWTIAIEMRRGHVPTESLLILGEQPLADVNVYTPHILYDFINEEGISYHIKGYAVPVGEIFLFVPSEPVIEELAADNDQLDDVVMDPNFVKVNGRNPRMMLTCLATSTRLRGQENNNTRWFSPSSCPEWRQP